MNKIAINIQVQGKSVLMILTAWSFSLLTVYPSYDSKTITVSVLSPDVISQDASELPIIYFLQQETDACYFLFWKNFLVFKLGTVYSCIQQMFFNSWIQNTLKGKTNRCFGSIPRNRKKLNIPSKRTSCFIALVLRHQWKRSVFTWLLNNTDLNCMCPLIQGFPPHLQ